MRLFARTGTAIATLLLGAVAAGASTPGGTGPASSPECGSSGDGTAPDGTLARTPGPSADEAERSRRQAEDLRAALGELAPSEVERRLGPLLEAVRELPDASRAELLIHLSRTQRMLAARSPMDARARLLGAAAGSLEEAAAAATRAKDWRLRSYAEGYRGELYEELGQLGAAQRLTRSALFDAQRASSLDASYRWYWQLGRIERAQGQRRQAVESYRSAVTALDGIRRAAAPDRAGAASFRRSVAPVYQGLTELLLDLADDEGDAEALQSLLREVRDTQERYRVAELRDYFGDACLDLQRRTLVENVPHTVVVHPILLPDRVELVVGENGRLTRYTVPVGRDELTAEVRSLRRLLEKRTTRQYLAPSMRLYDWLIRPLQPILESDDVDALVFVPGGPLRTIPFSALYDREAQRFLVERVPVAVTPGVALTEPRPIDRAHAHALVAGISKSVQGYPALAGVRSEVDAIEALFPGDQLLDDQFEVDRFEKRVESRPFSIVHVASHGEFRADTAESFLVAYDGRLSMDRLADLVATTRFRREVPLELLTLSACETAVDDDRAALGLAGIALRAGARSALATLWAVQDEASSQLVSEFYTQLDRPGRSRARALQQAQLHLLAQRAFRHPAYWAPFLLINSWL